MKKLVCVAVSALLSTTLISCGGNDEFKPSLDPETKCDIKVVGDYGNFEALEAEFDRFNAFYPNVSLSYEKLDKYNSNLATALEREDKPNIFFSYTWMMGSKDYEAVVAHMENLSDANLKINLDCLREGLVNHDDEGNVLMVPVFSRTYGTLVNTDLFKKEGLEVPKTWDELVSICNTFAERGYKSPMMGFSLNSSSCLMNTIAYPEFVSTLAKNPEALASANKLEKEAGEYMRGALTKVKELVDSNAINLEECNKLEKNYDPVIFRFFEGDVPMMICAGDTVSGTKKRESQSEAFTNSPFEYSYYPIPLNEQGGYFIDSPSVQFSVNKNCKDLDMTNEFMRFLVRNEELNLMASNKRLVTPTKELSFDPVYAPFGKVPADRTYSPEVLGIKDALAVQIRVASFEVGKGTSTIDQAIAKFGEYK